VFRPQLRALVKQGQRGEGQEVGEGQEPGEQVLGEQGSGEPAALLEFEDVKIEVPNRHTEAMSSPQAALWKEAEKRELVLRLVPNSHTEAMSSPQAALWKGAEERELVLRLAHGTWEVPIGGCWTNGDACQ
jgi:hypothetical protein